MKKKTNNVVKFNFIFLSLLRGNSCQNKVFKVELFVFSKNVPKWAGLGPKSGQINFRKNAFNQNLSSHCLRIFKAIQLFPHT